LKRLTPLKAIKKFCLDCCGGSRKAVEECTANPTDIASSLDPDVYTVCVLWEYRFGKNPRRLGVGGQKKTPVLGQKRNSSRGL
jgi:hypothetical protein